jgi:hypothetical protein
MPAGLVNPAVTVVTKVGLRETMEIEPPRLAVQIREPSKAMPVEIDPKELVSAVTAPAGCVESIIYRLPGFVSPVTKILPIAQTMPKASVAPV